MIPALLIRLEAIAEDAALDECGYRKIAVTHLREASEQAAAAGVWRPSAQCPVLVTENLETAVFNEKARQDRHYHERATEIYIPIEGSVVIEVEGVDYSLRAGDMLVVNPGARHIVKPGGRFLCRSITANCGGEADKRLAG